MTMDFEALLSKQIGTETGSKPIPQGTYFGQIAKLPESKKRNTKEGEKAVTEIVVNLTEAGDDVDAEALAGAGGLSKSNGDPRTMTHVFWLTENAIFMLDNFLASFGFTGTYADGLAQLPGQPVMLYVTQESYEKNGSTRTVNRIDTIVADPL